MPVLDESVTYYNESRTHQSPDGNAPEPRRVRAVGQAVAEPVLGGLHHLYLLASAGNRNTTLVVVTEGCW